MVSRQSHAYSRTFVSTLSLLAGESWSRPAGGDGKVRPLTSIAPSIDSTEAPASFFAASAFLSVKLPAFSAASIVSGGFPSSVVVTTFNKTREKCGESTQKRIDYSDSFCRFRVATVDDLRAR